MKTKKIFRLTFQIALFLCVFTQKTLGGDAEISAVQTAQIPTDLAVRAIIGEAAGEPYETKLAIAGALRNRGSLTGVRGLRNSKMIDVQPAWVWTDSRRAWSESATNDMSQGGTHFESVNFKTPFWARDKLPVAKVGIFQFWKMKVMLAKK